MLAQRIDDQPLRESAAATLESLARLIRLGLVPSWQVERTGQLAAREIQIAAKVEEGIALARVGEPCAYRVDGGWWIIAYPCGCRRVQDDDGRLESRGFCEVHRALVVAEGGSFDAPREQRGLVSVLRRVK